MTDQREKMQTETPMRDRVSSFRDNIAGDHVRILVNMRRTHDDGSVHWDSASYGDDTAKAILAALSASGKKSDGSRVRQVDNARSHGEGLQYGPDTTITTGTDAPSIAAKVRDDGNVANQVETSGRAPHVLLGPSDPILSQPDERRGAKS